MGPIDLLRFRLEVLLHFLAQVGHLVRIVLQPGFLISRKDVLLAGIWRHSEDGVRIEPFLRSRGARARLPGGVLFFSLPRVLLLPLARFLLLPQRRFLLLPRFLPALFLLLCALLIRAFSSGKPHGFGGIMPALLAKVAGFRNVPAADAARAGRTSRLRDEENGARND